MTPANRNFFDGAGRWVALHVRLCAGTIPLPITFLVVIYKDTSRPLSSRDEGYR